MQIIESRGHPRPAELIESTTICLIRDGIRTETVTDEDGSISTDYVYTEYRLSPAEFAQLKKGTCSEWSAALHEIYRRELHRRTDDLYAMAQRKIRSGADESKWNDYMLALDGWNTAVSAMANGFSVQEPALPVQPAG